MSYADAGTPSPDTFAEDLGRTVKTLMAMRGLKVADMWRLLHLPKSTWYARQSDGEWTARQMAQLAEVLGVEVQDLYLKPEDLIRSRCFSPLTLVRGAGGREQEAGPTPSKPQPVTRPTLSVVRS